MLMKIRNKIINYCLIIILLSFPTSLANSKNVPISFADLAEKLMPSVVNISSTQTIKTTTNPFPFQFPPGSPFEDMFKEFNRPTERKATALGSGFIIDKKGIVVTNNHVIQGAEDIIVSVNGSTEYKAKVIGKDPYMEYKEFTDFGVDGFFSDFPAIAKRFLEGRSTLTSNGSIRQFNAHTHTYYLYLPLYLPFYYHT